MKTLAIGLLALASGVLAHLAGAAPHLAPVAVEGVPDRTISIPLQVANIAVPCSGFNATIYLPQGVGNPRVVRGPLLPNGFILASRVVTEPAGPAVIILAYSAGETFTGSGTLCELIMDVPAAMPTGNYEIILDAPDRSPQVRGSHALAGQGGLVSLSHTVSNGTLRLAYGDHVAVRGTPYWWLAGHNLVAPGMTFDEAELLQNGVHGYAAWQEYIADTDPNDPESFFRVLSIAPGSPLSVGFEPGSPGRVYTLLYSEGLTNGSWYPVPGVGPRRGTGGQDVMADPDPPPAGRFYRVQVQLP